MSINMENGRFGDGARSWQAAQEVAVVDWDKDTVGIFAMGIGSSTHNGDTVTPEIRWKNLTDGGAITVLGASGEVKVASVSALIDEDDLTTGEMGTSGTTRVTGNTCEQENSGIATSSTTLAKGEATEIQVGISFADGDPGDEYEFYLYESGVQINDPSVATVTLATEGTLYFQTNDGALTFTGDLIKKTLKLAFPGELTFVGILDASKVSLQLVEGAITFVGDVVKKTLKTAGVSGELTPSGTLLKKTSKTLTGELTSSGDLIKQTSIVQSVVGVLTFTGILTAVKLVVSGYRRFIGSGFFGGGRDR